VYFNAAYNRSPNQLIIQKLLNYEDVAKLQKWSELLVSNFNLINACNKEEDQTSMNKSVAKIDNNIKELAKVAHVGSNCLSILIEEFQSFREELNDRFDKLEKSITKRSF
jgi:hypothetical protein